MAWHVFRYFDSNNTVCYSWLIAAILADDSIKCIFFHSNVCLFYQISLKFVPKEALVSIVARRRIGDKPLSEPMLTRFSDAYVPYIYILHQYWNGRSKSMFNSHKKSVFLIKEVCSIKYISVNTSNRLKLRSLSWPSINEYGYWLYNTYASRFTV